MTPGWITTPNLELAAALRACGFAIRTDKTTDYLSGDGWQNFLVATSSSPALAITNKVGTLNSSTLRGHFINNTLDKLRSADPAHPFLDALGVLNHRRQILAMLKDGAELRLATGCDQWNQVLVEGREPPSILRANYYETRSIKIVAALSRMGVNIRGIRGSASSATFELVSPARGVVNAPPLDTAELMRSFHERRLHKNDPHHRLLYLLAVLEVRDRLHDYITGRTRKQLIRDPERPINNLRAVVVPETVDSRTLDKLRRTFKIP